MVYALMAEEAWGNWTASEQLGTYVNGPSVPSHEGCDLGHINE